MSKDTLSLIHDNLFRGDENLSEKQVQQLRRYEAAFTIWLEKPWMADADIRNFLIAKFGLSRSQAYVDIRNLQLLLGNVRNSSKEWFRHMANELVKSAVNELEDNIFKDEPSDEPKKRNGIGFNREQNTKNETHKNNTPRQRAESLSDKFIIGKALAKIKAAEALVKINRLNKTDADPFDWSAIELPSLEPTNDPVEAGVLRGITRKELQEKIRKAEEKYSEIIEIRDVDYEEGE